MLKLTEGETGGGDGGGGGEGVKGALGQGGWKNGVTGGDGRGQPPGVVDVLPKTTSTNSTSSTAAATTATGTAASATASASPAGAAGAAVDGTESSRPMLLSTLKENLENLGASRAALYHESTGSGNSSGGGSSSRSSGGGGSGGGGGGIGDSGINGGSSGSGGGGGDEGDTSWRWKKSGTRNAVVLRSDAAAAAGQGSDSNYATGARGVAERETRRSMPAISKTDDNDWSLPPTASCESAGNTDAVDNSSFGTDSRVSVDGRGRDAHTSFVSHSVSGGSNSSGSSDDRGGSSNINSSSSNGGGSVNSSTSSSRDGGDSNQNEDKYSKKAAIVAAVVGDDDDDDGNDDDNRLHFLHEMYVARPEPSLLPLYPPGDQFLVHSSCRSAGPKSNAGVAATAAAASAAASTVVNPVAAHAHQKIADIVSSYRSGSVSDSGSNGSTAANSELGIGASVALTGADDSRGWEGGSGSGGGGAVVSTATVASATAAAAAGNRKAIRNGNEIGNQNGSRNENQTGNQIGNQHGTGDDTSGRVNARKAMADLGRNLETNRHLAEAGENASRGERQRSRVATVGSAAADAEIEGLGEATARAGKGSGLGEEGARSENNMLLMRVPHQHFLRMALSPNMLEDHTMSAYQRALQGLRKRGGE